MRWIPILLLAIAPGQSLTDQRFEWQSAYTYRWEGTYGQYEVNLAAGTTYEIYTSNVVFETTSDPYLYLLNTSGVIVARDDDSGEGLNSRILYTPSTTATYWIRLRAYSKGRYGTCTLTVLGGNAPPPPDPDPDPEPPPGEIAPGTILTGQVFEWQSAFSFRWQGTYGQYAIRMTAGEVYTFETSNAVGGGGDTYLYLLNAGLSVVASDDDSGAGLHSRLRYVPSSSGTFYLRLRAYSRGASGTCTLTVSGPGAGGNPLLPDLLCWARWLRDVRISNEGGRKLLRFSNSVANRGAGPLEMYGQVSSDGTTRAYQVVYNDNGTTTTYQVGTFSFAGHETHGHWHFDDFARYELRRSDTNELVRLADKVSFCLLDSVRYTDESVPGTPSSAHYTCSNQGISVGWADVYSYNLDGQFIDVTGLPDGMYRLVSITDPAGRLHESSTLNNAGSIHIQITGNTVSVLP